MAAHMKTDVCVIGAGAGGLSVAVAAAAFGVSVVLVEKGRMGGDCLNYGCVPSKALLAAARTAATVRDGGFGIAGAEPVVDYGKVREHVRETIAAIAPNDSVERMTALGITVIRGEAKFVDRRTLQVGSQTLRARRFVIATGSTPFVPSISGIFSVNFLTNETLLNLSYLPAHLLVIGGGPVGVEMAQAYRRLGSAVTLVDSGSILGREDPELSAVVRARLKAEGIVLHEATSATGVEKVPGGVRLACMSAAGAFTVEGSNLLVAAGRTPSLQSLDLRAAGVRTERGKVRKSAGYRTSNRRIYVVGDAAGGQQFTHAAGHHAETVVRQILFRLPARVRETMIPRVTFTDPELAHVGLGEEEAAKRYGQIRVLRWPLSENDRAQTEGRTEGLIKVVARRDGTILGASIVGAEAGEMINMWSLALARGLKLRDMASFVSPYPTFSEIGKRAAMTYYQPLTRKPLIRRIVRLLARFG